MLKELWRKLGSELWQENRAGDGVESGVLSRRKKTYPKGFRILPHITHTGEFHLERLTKILKERYGQSFSVPDSRSENDGAIRELISFASRIQDQDIQRELLLFYLNCSPVIQEYLRSQTDLGEGPFLTR
ncbi:hypothetical protein MD273_17730 [Marinobacter pelagius]|uniref:hypothetical protein n=1 Tax=Marinobacter sp. C7 TaxID=2951363 RepID=UPI001EF085B7|nr:hypothetical protein [Marinobacter sp. C7]MCG7201582.1 hypothetical protein [Marinobacter sp. C7]